MKLISSSLRCRLAVVMVIAVSLFVTACSTPKSGVTGTEPPTKSSLKILYVGTNPDKPLTDREKERLIDPDREVALRKTRASDFEALLNGYFSVVEVVYGDTYQEAMSADYDVTIIDTYLPAKSGGRGIDPETGQPTYEMPKFLSEEYNYATVMIGEPSALIGQGRELKIDHLCLCLDAHANNMKLDHPIFHAPYPVEVITEERKVPSNFKARYTGRNLGDTMPMWRVQTEGYHDGKGFPIGLVSTGHGVDGSPDAEWISSGRCDKGIDAMALGRHANFFHWGFAAAPEYMTESAKLAFINSIHYIAPFKGAQQITRKIKYMPLREYTRESQWMMSDAGWAAWSSYLEEGNEKRLKSREKLQAKKDAGEELTEFEAMSLQMPLRKETRAWTIRHEPAVLKTEFGEDWAAYERYYAENMDYFYPVLVNHYYENAVDEDAKSLGIANHRVELLETAVAMLETGDQTEMAQRLLTRYTNETFQSAEEWKKWLSANRDQLYFSEGDGYKFIVLSK